MAPISSHLCLYQHQLNPPPFIPPVLSYKNLMQNLYRNPMLDQYLMRQFLLQARQKNLNRTKLLTGFRTISGSPVFTITRLAVVRSQYDSLHKNLRCKTKETSDTTTSLCSLLKPMPTLRKYITVCRSYSTMRRVIFGSTLLSLSKSVIRLSVKAISFAPPVKNN